MRAGELVFVDTGAWIALALTCDPLHPRASETWALLANAGARLHTSVSIVVETFMFLDRNTERNVALAWKDSLKVVPGLRVLPSTPRDLEHAWKYFERPDFHKLSAVDALSFVLMAQRRIRVAFAFDSHFATAGFRMVG
jgi:predicted nucleic acid-binding protein